MLDVVVESVAVADALERKPRHERNDLGEARMRRPEPIPHVDGQERAEGFRAPTRAK